MNSYNKIFRQLVKGAYQGKLQDTIEEIKESSPHNHKRLDLLLNPDNLPPVIHLEECPTCKSPEPSPCEVSCLFSAVKRDASGQVIVSPEACVGCASCLESCHSGLLVDRKDFIPLFEMLSSRKYPVYAMIAPAFVGQFSPDVTPGKLRAAFKQIGFYGMLEVALFADILTLKEALEFDRFILEDKDFMLTSCCCPIWVAMIRKIHDKLVPHVSPSVSPMVACGRSIKHLHPEAKTVFIGPCIAKKAEAKEKDLIDAVDFVLTFEETALIFEAAKIDPVKLEEDERDHSSRTGRIYARTGGVSQAVSDTIERLNSDRQIPLRAEQGNGIRECKKLLEEIQNGEVRANFLEGMGCPGGCVGGPKRIIEVDKGAENVNNYGNQAIYMTSVDNPFVLELLQRLGYPTIESLLEKEDSMFTRVL
ncbi:MAG: iron hydrogenase [Desulfitobacterium hafniense]|nr:iron hydrogenase [Desulfitobacterium hafniense]